MPYSDLFNAAFDLVMKYEIGPWFNANDPGTISGAIGTPQQRRMVGYVDIDGDSGGLTKYGIAKTDHPNVDVANLNLAEATSIFYQEYWLAAHLDQVNSAASIYIFDMAVNNGLGRASKILQQAAGVAIDGDIGPGTLAAVNSHDPHDLVSKMYSIRVARYKSIVANNPEDEKFLDGWLRRALEVEQFTLSKLSN